MASFSGRERVRKGAETLAVVVCTACAASLPRQPAGLPPTRASVTLEQPGGDAADPHVAALDRLLQEPWGTRTDKDRELGVPLADAKNWKRVRFWGLDHFVGFRYGEDIHAVSSVFVEPPPKGEPASAESCMRGFELWAEPQMKNYRVKLGAVGERAGTWKKHPILVHQVSATVPVGFETSQVTAAWAAYPAYSDACLVFALVVPWRDHEAEAKAVVDRWVDQGLKRIKPLTRERPYRK